ncbi:MAG: MucB/RseB C-terminal domain-containing protein [Steroidobacteraceae bacterium]
MRTAGALLAASFALASFPARSDDDARQWLERMSEALTSRNYTGVFTHSTRRQSETMRIVHRVDDGESTERLVSLDGSGREIVRTAREVHVYLPDRSVVLVEPRSDEGSLVGKYPEPGPELDRYYVLEIHDGPKLLGRDVVVLDVRPRDAYRFGYRLWLDEKSAMPLRTVVVDPAGRPVETITFTELELPKKIRAGETETSLDATGYRWVRNSKDAEARPRAVAWLPTRLPPGFKLVNSRLQVVPGVALPVQHLIFSDGFASISVFIEPVRPDGNAPAESSSVGSASAFSTTVHGHVVTAVGEVPLETVRDVARSVEPVTMPATLGPPGRATAPPAPARPVDAPPVPALQQR